MFPLFISFLGRERHFVIGEIVPILSCETKIGCQEQIALQSSGSVSNHLNKITQGCFLMKSCFRPRILSVDIFYNGHQWTIALKIVEGDTATLRSVPIDKSATNIKTTLPRTHR